MQTYLTLPHVTLSYLMYAAAAVLQLTGPQSPLSVGMNINKGRAPPSFLLGTIDFRFITFFQFSLVFVGDTKTAGDESDKFHIKYLLQYFALQVQVHIQEASESTSPVGFKLLGKTKSRTSGTR